MKIPRAVAIVAIALVCAVMSGCGGQPQPVTSTPLFSSEDEAFAAAEETYRSYVDALNQVDLSDPETFEEVYAWTTGDANAGERKSLSKMHADGWTVSGETAITRFQGQSIANDTAAVVALACTDVSAVTVNDGEGKSVVAHDRPTSYTVEISFVSDDQSDTGLKISASNAIETNSCSIS
ncbi:hypothetical protein ASD65_00765 [Microbacterium sp. Root61]|nr:hypothetical protein ASD65_00765 [Microbacterium sp. Root61]